MNPAAMRPEQLFGRHEGLERLVVALGIVEQLPQARTRLGRESARCNSPSATRSRKPASAAAKSPRRRCQERLLQPDISIARIAHERLFDHRLGLGKLMTTLIHSRKLDQRADESPPRPGLAPTNADSTRWPAPADRSGRTFRRRGDRCWPCAAQFQHSREQLLGLVVVSLLAHERPPG